MGRILFTARAGEFTLADVGNLSTSQLIAALAPGARVVKAPNNMIVPNLEADPVLNGRDELRLFRQTMTVRRSKLEPYSKVSAIQSSILGNLGDGGLIQQAGGPLAERNLWEEGERHK